jgi:hypothetical protein
MVREPSHHLSAGVVEDDHIVLERLHLLKGEELAYLELMGDGKCHPPLVDECGVAFFPRSHPLAVVSVVADDDVQRDGSKALDEVGRDWELPEGGLEDDSEEVVRPYVVVEVADISIPSSTLLGWSLTGNHRRWPKLDLLGLHREHMPLEVAPHKYSLWSYLIDSDLDRREYMNKDMENINEASYIGSHGNSRDCPRTKSSVQRNVTHTRIKFEGSTLLSKVSYLNHWPMQSCTTRRRHHTLGQKACKGSGHKLSVVCNKCGTDD